MATTNTTNGIVIKQGATYVRSFFFGTTGQTVAVNISKAGAAFGVATNSPATEIANGWYSISLSVTDTSTVGDLAFHCTAASGGPAEWNDQIQTHVFADLTIDASGNVSIASSFKKNQTAILPFLMTTGNPPAAATGLTVTAQRSLAGAGYAPCANSVNEVGNGGYVITLAPTDTNASVIFYRFTSPGANDQDITLYTQP